MLRNLLKHGVNNPVMVNIVTAVVLVVGLYSAFTIICDLLPEMQPNRVVVTTIYPGAAPEDIERGVTEKIEEVIEDIDGVDQIFSVTIEGSSQIVVELVREADLDRAVEDIKAAIDTIDDFPEDVETPVVSRFDPKMWVISVAVYGDVNEEQLKQFTEEVRDDIRDLVGVSDMNIMGLRDEQINIDVDPQTLQAYQLSLLDVVTAVGQANLDMPGGLIRMASENVAVRTLGERRRAAAISDIVVRACPDGKILTVGQIARVKDGFAEADLSGRFNGKPGANIAVFRAAGHDAIDTADKIRALVAAKMSRPFKQEGWVAQVLRWFGRESATEAIWRQASAKPLPPGVYLQTRDDMSRLIRDRLNLLRRTGKWGLILVFLSLLLFLNRWVAFWVMSGVFLSLLGTLAIMKQLGWTLNLISMFGLVVALGLLVDDAIVIGESIYRRVEQGTAPHEAAVLGTSEVSMPVIAAVVTTICAFVPLTMLQGRLGDMLWVLPMVAGISLLISLFESLLLLPSHLAESLHAQRQAKALSSPTRNHRRLAWRNAYRRFAEANINKLLLRPYRRLLDLSLAHRYTTLAVSLAAFVVCVGLVVGRRVQVVTFPKMDTDFAFAELRMPVGTPAEQTERALKEIEKVADDQPDIKHYYTLIGAHASQEEPTFSGVGAHLGQLLIELTPMEQRTRTTDQIISELRKRTSHLTGIQSLHFSGAAGPQTAPDISIEISGREFEHILSAAQYIKDTLSKFAGVYEIRDDFEAGQREMKISLLPSARALGLTTWLVSQQVRSAFHGLEARTIQRGREAVDIIVRYGRENRTRLSDLESMWISTPIGTRVPLTEVATLTEGLSNATLHHTDRRRAVTVFAEVDPARGNVDEIIDAVEAKRSEFENRYAGVRFRAMGTRRETKKALESLSGSFALALMLIYVCLASLFRSYAQPLIVMISIPMAFIGMVLGHWIMGYPITILSRIGYVALAGIAVNDALILVDYANIQVREGLGRIDAIRRAGMRRLRPILLTSLTTILGLAPLMTERSFQARFLIPMAISVTFGLAVATLLTLLLVPALYLIFEDINRLARRVWCGAADETALPHD